MPTERISSLMAAPDIDTERTRLRAHRLDDFEPMMAMWQDEAIFRHITGRPSTCNETWSRLLRYIGHWHGLGFGYWVIEDRETGLYLGEAGFADFHRDMAPPLGPAPEAGWAIVSPAHGRGLATEVMTAAHAWMDERNPHGRTTCILDPMHHASRRVADKCGYLFDYETTLNGETTAVMRRPVARKM
ncbi:GNAT family N-acetyltransferase [Rhizobium sp. AQ_MP]|uniref:GNAT family N-acetyltransferase n=1 Tax=Rhizobium sp. AQ_MP TaxID=2761536 RepID=UPI001FED4686|nr:GNAT family N-acetyltransferase [Rhizobium sp. AQ_MP]